MGRLTPEEIEELRKRSGGVKDPVGRTDVRTPVESRDRTPGRGFPSFTGWRLPKTPPPEELPDVWGALDRAARIGGLAAGTGVGLVLPKTKAMSWTPDVYGSGLDAARAFWNEASRGDWDSAIEAYQDEMDAGKGFWGASELLGALIPTGGPAFAGTRLLSAAPKLATTLGRVLPATRRSEQAIRGIETGLRGIGKGLRAPWEAEEAVGRAAMKGLGLGARAIRYPRTGPLAQAVRKLRPGREGVEQAVGDMPVEDVIKADEILGQAPTPPVTPGARATGVPGFGAIPGAEDVSVYLDDVVEVSGRKIAMVRLADGKYQPFYKRTGEGGKEVAGANVGDWVPFNGFAIYGGPMGIPPGWINKFAYQMPKGIKASPLERWGTEANKRIGLGLKNIEESLPSARKLSKAEANNWMGVSDEFTTQGQGRGWTRGKGPPETAGRPTAVVPVTSGARAVDEMVQDGNKLAKWMQRTGRERGLLSGKAGNIEKLNMVRRGVRAEKAGKGLRLKDTKSIFDASIGTPMTPDEARILGADYHVLREWASKAGLRNTDPQYVSDALWLAEAKRSGLNAEELIRKYPDSFPTRKATPTDAATRAAALRRGRVPIAPGVRATKKAAQKELPLNETVPDEQAASVIEASDPSPIGGGIEAPVGWQRSEELVDPPLPARLRGAKPRYNIGLDNYIPQFESDIDKAFFIVSQKTLSKKDDLYMDFLQKLFSNKNTQELRILGREVRDHIKKTVQAAEPGEVIIPRSNVVLRELDPSKRVPKQPVGPGGTGPGGRGPGGRGPGGRGPVGRDPKAPKPGDNLDESKKEIEDYIARVARPDELKIKGTAKVMKEGKPQDVYLYKARVLLRKHEAAVNVMQNDLSAIVLNGEKQFRALGLSVGRKGREVILEKAIREGTETVPEGEMRILFKALHGEGEIPERLRGAYDDLRRLTDWEENARIDFDPEIRLVGKNVDESQYFYRGWKMGDALRKASKKFGGLGWPPKFDVPRRDASFDDMLKAGFEPLSWNPYEQWRIGTLQGMRYREQVLLVKRMKTLDLAQFSGDASKTPINGWRVPEVGPAFEGKTRQLIDSETGETMGYAINRWAVPDNMAKRLEAIYGKTPQIGTLEIGRYSIDPLDLINVITFLPKRAKLYLSLFQQQDFLLRSGAGAWTKFVDDLQRGIATKDPKLAIGSVKNLAVWPKAARDILESNFSPGFRARLKNELTSTKPLNPKRPGVHLRGIMEAGLSVRDVTMFPANMDEVMRDVASENGLLGIRKVVNLISDIDSASRRGLFDGVYPAAQVTDIKNNIANLVIKQFPEQTDEAINGIIAHMVNMKYSTIPTSQSVFQNHVLRGFLQRLFFSIGESEGLLRQAFEAVPYGGVARMTEKAARGLGRDLSIPVVGGQYGSLWRKHWAGAYLAVIATANAIHFASTGKPLPVERYVPLQKNNWGHTITGWVPQYRTRFAAPSLPTGRDPKWYAPLSRLPLGGRNATENTIDLVGQMDTAFRILDPKSFLTSRESVPVRALSNQVTGTNFFGEPIDEVGPGGIVSRTANALMDMFAPIGVGQTGVEILRDKVPAMEKILPFGEGRIGTLPQLIQAGGINIRGESTPDLRDRLARESGLINVNTGQPVQTWDELLPSQEEQVRGIFPQLSEEEEIRTKVQARRQNEYAMRREEVQTYQDHLINTANDLSEAYLEVSLTGGKYNPEKARKEISKAEDIYYGELYGTKWDEEKRRFTGGIYDEDIDFEEPEKETVEHALWRYRNIYQDARDDKGDISFDKEAGVLLNKAVNEFWADLNRNNPGQVSEVLANIRLIEGKYSRQMQVMKDAGRYAGSLKLNLGGENVSYYDLEDHKMVEDYIVREAGVSRAAIREYLGLDYSDRNAAKVTPQGEDIAKALNKASSKNGILWRLRQSFVTNAGIEWKQAMFEAGYNYQGKEDLQKRILKKLRAGSVLARLDYETLYMRELERIGRR